MPHVLDYYARRTFRPLWGGYVVFAAPGLIIILWRFYYVSAAHLIAKSQHPSGVRAYSELRWAWESRLVGAMFQFVGVAAILLIPVSVLVMISKPRRWLSERVPGWFILLVVNWIIVLWVGLTPIFRD